MRIALAAVLVLSLISSLALAEVFFTENFYNLDKWTQSKAKSDFGEWKIASSDWYGDAEEDKGMQASQEARHYAISAKLDKKIETTKDKTLVLQYTTKWPNGIDCGGAYMKVLPTKSLEDKQDKFDGNTEYSIMFGPDVCGATKRIHLIFNYKGKNLLWKKSPRCETDKLTHVYTAIIKPDNTYEVLVDGKSVESGSLYDDWDFIPPKEIEDPEDKKPEDWVDEKEIADPEDKKPEDWDKEPKFIPDPEAKKPEDWDDEEDGEWEAPKIPNPEYKGEWKPRMIPNPDYKGEWAPRKIPNPDYFEDDEVYRYDDIGYIGVEIWTVKSGLIIDNMLVTDDVDEAAKHREAILERMKKEKEAFDKIEEEERKKREEERKKREEEEKKKREEEAEKEEKKEESEKDELKKEAEKKEEEEETEKKREDRKSVV